MHCDMLAFPAEKCRTGGFLNACGAGVAGLMAGAGAAGVLALGSPAAAQVAIGYEFVAPAGFATALAQPPGETSRLYFTSREGRVRLVRPGSQFPVDLLMVPVDTAGEGGLLGMAFHPQFQLNGFVYIIFTTAQMPAGVRIMRYTLDPANPEFIDASTAFPIMTMPHLLFVHVGGWIGFGPDGYLYISTGDGASPTFLQAQENTSLYGKLLRIDVDRDDFPADPAANYAIPPDNPLAGVVGVRQEIWARGLRNPWRCSFDRLTGDLWIGDVGGNFREEINMQPAALSPPHTLHNYGWPCWEGTMHRPENCSTAAPPFTPPIFDYPRLPGGFIVGGYVYRGAAIPALRGTYVASEPTRGLLRLRYDPSVGITKQSWSVAPPPPAAYALGEDNAGELYLLGHAIYRIVPACHANCDGSTVQPVLNIGDFVCFINLFAAGDPYANCDGSTVHPVLNVNDFICFINLYAAGCG